VDSTKPRAATDRLPSLQKPVLEQTAPIATASNDETKQEVADMNFIVNETLQKLRGGYYTPLDLAGFLTRWLSDISPQSLLEPSCGDGAFFHALANVAAPRTPAVTAFEVDIAEAEKAKNAARSLGVDAKIRSEDFLGWALKHLNDRDARFDAVAGNPPFIRYQYLPAEFQARAEKVFDVLGLPFTKHTNAWVPFVLISLELLRPGGRLAMVVPAEIIHVMHAQSLRTFLGRQCRRVVLIDPQELWFDNTLQGAVLLLAEKRRSAAEPLEGLAIYEVSGREFLKRSPADIFNSPQCLNGKTVDGKWTRALLDKETRDLLDELAERRDVHRFADVANVDVGIVTGANKYFLVTDEVVQEYGLQRWAHPMFGRSEHCPGVIYDAKQHRANARNGNPSNFLWFDDEANLDDAAQRYIRLGEEEKLHTRYKCRVRTPWFTVPSVYATEIGMLKRSHDTPRLILNRLRAYTTDTSYRIRSLVAPPEMLVACFTNPLTALSAELEGRHYGGGVLELVPSEIERLAVPLPRKFRPAVRELDRLVRTRTAAEVLDVYGVKVLDALGCTRAQHRQLLVAWDRLRRRRQRIGSAEADADAA